MPREAGSGPVMVNRDSARSRIVRLGSLDPIPASAFAAGAVALWSSNALVGKALLARCPVSQVQFLQFAGAALVFGVIYRFSRDRGPKASAALAETMVGFVGLVGTMVLQYIAFASMPVIEANLVGYTWPLLVAVAAIALDNPRRPALLGLSAVVGLVGVALVISGGRDHFRLGGHLVGYLAAFGSALCMAFYSVVVGRIVSDPARLLLPSSLIGIALTFVWSAWDGVHWRIGVDLALGLYLGAGPMGLGYYFWSRALTLGGGRVALAAYLTPIASTLLLTWSGERLTTMAVAGAALVIGSCIAVGMERSEAANDV